MTPQADEPIDEFDLGNLDDAYAKAPDDDAPIPDGQYTAAVVDLRRSKSSNAKMLEWTLRIAAGVFAGRKVWKYTLLETPEQMSRAKTDLKRCGVELTRLSELPARLKDLLDVTVAIAVKTDDEFTAVYFRRPEREAAGKPAARTTSAQSRVF